MKKMNQHHCSLNHPTLFWRWIPLHPASNEQHHCREKVKPWYANCMCSIFNEKNLINRSPIGDIANVIYYSEDDPPDGRNRYILERQERIWLHLTLPSITNVSTVNSTFQMLDRIVCFLSCIEGQTATQAASGKGRRIRKIHVSRIIVLVLESRNSKAKTLTTYNYREDDEVGDPCDDVC